MSFIEDAQIKCFAVTHCRRNDVGGLVGAEDESRPLEVRSEKCSHRLAVRVDFKVQVGLRH